MLQAGSLKTTYGKSRSFLIVWWFLALLIGGTAAFVLSLIPRIGVDLNFSGNVALLHAVGWGGLAVALGLIVVPWRLAASQPTFHLHDQAIRAVGPQEDSTDCYRDIEDLYTFFFGGLAYRATPKSRWIFIGSRITRFAELSDRLRALHANQRGEKLYQGLLKGETARFRCLSDEVALSKSLFASRNMDHPTFDIELTRHRLTVRDKSIPVDRIAQITNNSWTERSQIIDTDGQVFHTMHPTAIMSFGVLCVLIMRLQQEHTAAAA